MQHPKFASIVLSVLLLGLCIVAMCTTKVRADTISGATSGVQVHNLDPNPATVSFKVIDQNGNIIKSYTDPFPIPGNSSKTYFPLDAIGLSGAFNGSLVVSSDKALAAIVNVNATSSIGVPIAATYESSTSGGGAPILLAPFIQTTGSFNKVDTLLDRQDAGQRKAIVTSTQTPAPTSTYARTSSVGQTLTLPLIMKNNGAKKFDTLFNVQNAGQSDTTITVAYIPAAADTGNTGCRQTAVIKPGAAVTFNQHSETNYIGCPGLLGSKGKFVGSAIVTSNPPTNIAAAVLEVSEINLLAYTGFSPNQASTAPIFPLVNNNNNGNVTSIQIANLGTQDTDVTVSYTPSPNSGTPCTEKQTIKAGSSATFALNAFANSSLGANENCPDGSFFVGSGIVTGNSTNQPLVGVINQVNNVKGFGSAYSSFNAATATGKVSLPLILDYNGKFHISTGISVVNVGKDPVNITCTYSTQNGNKPAPDSATNVAPGSALVKVNNNLHVGNTAYVGSAECTATGSGETKIVGVVNQAPALLNVGGAPAGDKLLTYGGFNH